MVIIVKETSIEEALKVFEKIPEFDRPKYGTIEFCKERIDNKDCLILSAYADEEIVGYFIAYGKDDSFYCWLAAVEPKYRRKGILFKMMNIFEEYARNKKYQNLTIKTGNNKREMLNYLIKNNWNFVQVIPSEKLEDNEIILKKEL